MHKRPTLIYGPPMKNNQTHLPLYGKFKLQTNKQLKQEMFHEVPNKWTHNSNFTWTFAREHSSKCYWWVLEGMWDLALSIGNTGWTTTKLLGYQDSTLVMYSVISKPQRIIRFIKELANNWAIFWVIIL